MTEQEAIRELQFFKGKLYNGIFGNRVGVFEFAISALEEIQKYREYEERLNKIYGDCPGLLETVVKHLEAHEGVDLPEPIFKARLLTDGEADKWEAYKQLGTPEEIAEIGKPDEIKTLINRLNAVIATQHDKLATYAKLGTVEEIQKKLKVELPYMSIAQAKFKSELDAYRSIGTVEELREAREKQRAKKQGEIDDSESHFKLSKNGFLCCSVTNKDIRYPLISLRDLDYCPRCGQKLDWSEEE